MYVCATPTNLIQSKLPYDKTVRMMNTWWNEGRSYEHHVSVPVTLVTGYQRNQQTLIILILSEATVKSSEREQSINNCTIIYTQNPNK